MEVKSPKLILLFLIFFSWLISACDSPAVENKQLELPTRQPTQITTATKTTNPKLEDDENIGFTEEAPIKVESIHINTNHLGGTRILGLLSNSTQSFLNNVQIEILVFNKAEQIEFSQKIEPILKGIGPGQTTPFFLSLDDKLVGPHRITARIVDFSQTNVEAVFVEIQGESLSLGQGLPPVLSGEVINNNLDPIVIESMAAGLFSKDGKLITTGDTYSTIRYLDPGEKGPFQIYFPPLEGNHPPIVDFQSYIDARVIHPKPFVDILISNINSSSVDGTGHFQLIGEVTNNSEKTLAVSMIAGIYDDHDYLLDVSTGKLELPIHPGETLPIIFSDWVLMNRNGDYTNRAKTFSVQWDPYFTIPVDDKYILLETSEFFLETTSSGALITGSVINKSDGQVENAIIIVSVFDQSSRRIIATISKRINEGISMGQTANYSINIGIPDSYQADEIEVTVIAKGEIPTNP